MKNIFDEKFNKKTQNCTIVEMNHVVYGVLLNSLLSSCGDISSLNIDYECLEGLLQLDLKDRFDSIKTNSYLASYFYKKNDEFKNINNKLFMDLLYEIYIITNKYVYHGFSSSNLESIKKHGLNPALGKQTDDYIKYIALNKKYPDIFLDQIVEFDSGYVYCSYNAYNAYFYALSSPSWKERFTQFFNYNINYEKSKNRILKVIKENNLSEDEKSEILEFFEECWNSYYTQTPCLAIFNNPNNIMDKNYFKDFLMSINHGNDKLSLLESVLNMSHLNGSCKINKPVSPDSIYLFELPKLFNIEKTNDLQTV